MRGFRADRARCRRGGVCRSIGRVRSVDRELSCKVGLSERGAGEERVSEWNESYSG